MTASSLPDVGDVVLGKLEIIRTLGVGGMGAVFEVEHTITKHRRALKMLHGELTLSPSMVARFLREASAAGRIGNAHVVETFDAGKLDSGEPYIVMELLEGRTLADEIAERGALPVGETCEILLQACDGIRAAHAAGVVHRDLKPENLFLVAGARPFVKILDFGISKFDPELTGAHGLTQEGSALGTPYYMPPEQVRGEKDIGVQADVYALGVILYECLTADKPYAAETLPHLVVLIHEGRYTPPSVRRPGLPPECDAVVATAMAAERIKRYANIDELARALEILRGTGVRLTDERTLFVTPGARAETAQLGTPHAMQPIPQRTTVDSRPPVGLSTPPPPPPAQSPSVAPGTDSAAPPPGQTPVPAHTEGSFGNTQPIPAQKSNVALWAALAAGVLLSIGGAFWLFGGDGAEEPEPETAASTAPDSVPPSPAPAPSGPRADVIVVPPETEAAPSASAPAHAKTPHVAASPAPPAPPTPRPSSRAKELGLSEENPFR